MGRVNGGQVSGGQVNGGPANGGPAHGTLLRPARPVWIAAGAARTPLGACPASAAAAVRAGLSALAEHPAFTDRMGEPMRLALDAFLDPLLPRAQRMAALLDATLDGLPDGIELQLALLCLPEAAEMPATLATALAGRVAARFPGIALRTLTEGHAGGFLAFGLAATAIAEGRAETVLVLGIDSRVDRAMLERLDAAGDLKSEANRDGFFPGEAGGACLLAGAAGRARLPGPLARLAGVGAAVEPVTIRAETGTCTGEGLSAAIAALAPLAEGTRVTDTWCDMNGQRYRSEERLYTVLRSQAMFQDANDCEHPADGWGDVGAASGPLLALLALAAQGKRYARGARAMLWASSEGGWRAAALLDAEAG